jgi:sulfur carrier protein
MHIVINGEPQTLPESATLYSLLQANGISDQTSGIAVAVNDAVVPVRRWDELHLHDGDTVEVIHAVQGG